VTGHGPEHALKVEASGYFSGTVAGIVAGDLYRFRLDTDERLYADPASRFQPDGPHHASRVEDPGAYAWQDTEWRGRGIEGRVLYEMHVGTFTAEGTWAAAAEKLPHLASLGIDLVEMMPVADFPGRFGWGYDGVNLFAPSRLYGEPDDLRRFVDQAHRLGIGVILDVVYNHLGPDGNFLSCFAPSYFTDRYETEWGAAINFDGEGSAEVRRFFIENAAYWIEEFHFDGLRLDATQSIFDESRPHVIQEIVEAARAAAMGRAIVVIGENEPQHTALVRPPADGGYGLDALWNDDLHHSAMVAVSGRNEAYYADHAGEPQEFVAAAKYGYLFQGQVYAHQGQRRGTAGLDLPPAAMVTFVQNHDQVANSDCGLRFNLLGHPGAARAITAYLLLAPGTPMLFQGQEFWSSSPFFYFCDHEPELAGLVREGRREFLTQFPTIDTDAEVQARLVDPGEESTFQRSKLDWAECERNVAAVALHRDLVALRRSDPVFSRQNRGGLDGAVIGRDSFVLRFFGEGGDDRLLMVNLGRDFARRSIPDPLVAPPQGRSWSLLWSSERPAYGGHGTPEVETLSGWRLPAYSAVILAASTSSTIAAS
jgi:maltooligosyltrehalose trehalohydrolase